MARVAFFGVGLMGEPMAGHLLAAGHGVVVMAHRSRAGVERLVGKGAVEGSTALEAVERTEIAIMMLPTADEVEEVLFGAGGAARAMAPGYTVIDMGTSFPPQTRRLAARAEGFALAASAGLDCERLFQMLSASTSASPLLRAMVPKVFARAFDQVNFRLDMAYKDLRQATQLGREMTVPLPAANGAAEL